MLSIVGLSNYSRVGLVKKMELLYKNSELNGTHRYCLWVPNIRKTKFPKKKFLVKL